MPTVAVRWATTDVAESASLLLNDAEQSRWRAFVDPADRRRFLAAHVLARMTVAEVVGVEAAAVDLVQRCKQCDGPHGQPVAVVPGRAVPQLSFSHAGDLTVVAVGDAPVGVDVEPRRQTEAALAAIAELLPGAAAGDRLRRWVASEAAAKAAGTGFAVAPDAVDLDDVTLVDLAVDADYVAVLAVRGRRRPAVDLARVEWPALTGAPAAAAPTASGRTGR